MRLVLILILVSLCISCKKEDKKVLVPEEIQQDLSIDKPEKRRIYYPDTTRYDSIKNKFSLTSKNFNVNRIDFTLPSNLEDFQIQFSNIPNDRLKIGYIKKENTFYIGEEKTTHKRDLKKKRTHFSMILDTVSISFSVNNGASYISKEISPTIPYTVMTFLSKKSTMTQVVVSKNKTKPN